MFIKRPGPSPLSPAIMDIPLPDRGHISSLLALHMNRISVCVSVGVIRRLHVGLYSFYSTHPYHAYKNKKGTMYWEILEYRGNQITSYGGHVP